MSLYLKFIHYSLNKNLDYWLGFGIYLQEKIKM